MSIIHDWLNGPMDYEAGRLLYERLGSNVVLKRTLSHGPTRYNVSALREELVKMVKTGEVGDELTRAIVATAPTPLVVTLPNTNEATLIAGLEKQWKPLYKEASYLQSQLGAAKDNTERAKTAHLILEKMDKVQELWDASDHVKEHRTLPPVPVVAPPAVLDLTDAVAVLKRRNNLRSQIAKQRRNAERAADVAAWKKEVGMLDEVLKKLKK